MYSSNTRAREGGEGGGDISLCPEQRRIDIFALLSLTIAVLTVNKQLTIVIDVEQIIL